MKEIGQYGEEGPHLLQGAGQEVALGELEDQAGPRQALAGRQRHRGLPAGLACRTHQMSRSTGPW